ncbi:LOW QUALITY PROTEIN: vomeronasal type-1 receptor 4-like [Ctenodactylus gundi]
MTLNFVKGTILAFLSGLGTVGNITVFVDYIIMFLSSEKSIYLILIHLAFTNVITLLSKGVPSTIAALGVRNFLDDTGCKIICYLERVARGVTICTSSLLTVIQAITISPRHSRWRRHKPKSAWHILGIFLFFWILNSLIGINLTLYITSNRLNKTQTSMSDYYCDFRPENQKIKWIFLFLMILRDSSFLGVMGGAVHMVFLLHKHHQHVLHLQNSTLYKTPPEIKAAQSVLLLMLCFLSFYWMDCVLSLFVSNYIGNYFMVINIKEFLTLGYVILSPFVLIHRDGHLGACWKAQ